MTVERIGRVVTVASLLLLLAGALLFISGGYPEAAVEYTPTLQQQDDSRMNSFDYYRTERMFGMDGVVDEQECARLLELLGGFDEDYRAGKAERLRELYGC